MEEQGGFFPLGGTPVKARAVVRFEVERGGATIVFIMGGDVVD